MGDDVTGYNGEKLGEMKDHHDGSGKYLGTAFVEEKGCLEMLLIIWLPIIITLMEVTRG